MHHNELNLFEDPTRYTKEEMHKLKRRMIVGNEESSGFKAITTCYGIICKSLYYHYSYYFLKILEVSVML